MANFEQKPNLADKIVAVTTAAYTITEEPGAIYTNTGSATTTIFTLPVVSANGVIYGFICTVAQLMVIRSPGAGILHNGLNVNFLSSKIIGSFVQVIFNGTQWCVYQSTANPLYWGPGFVGNQSGMLALSSGGSTSKAVIDPSTLTAWAWGRNNYGQLGNNSTVNASSPVSVAGGRIFIGVNGGTFFTTALDTSGAAWAWGQGSGGVLGNNSTANISSPVAVVGGKTFVNIFSGTGHTVGLEAGTGAVWAWGYNNSGQLGNNSTANTSSPISVLGGRNFVAIAAGSNHSLALDSQGNIWSWGSNSAGQLGNNSTANTSSPVSVIRGSGFSAITAAINQSFGLTPQGALWAWGDNSFAQLGDNTLTSRSSPVSVVGGKTFITMAASQFFGIALEANTKALWSWGYNLNGQLGNNSTLATSSPVSVVGGKSFATMSILPTSACALEQGTGVFWSWGLNSSGQLGNNSTVSASSPVSVVRTFL